MLTRKLVALLLAAGTAGPGLAQSALPPDSVIQRILDDRLAQRRTFGLVLGTRDARGVQRIYRVGSSGRDGVSLDGNSVFEIASITKTFTAALLADMTMKGEVRLTDPVFRFLPPEVTMPAGAGTSITLQDLATHSSGLPALPSNIHPANVSNPYVDYSVDQLYQFLSSHVPEREVGAAFVYSNLGFGLLGHVLARRAGTSWDSAVTARILEPLGMSDTRITLDAGMGRRLAVGHDGSGREVPNWDIPSLPGFGALRSTVRDMLKYLAANMDSTSAPLGRTLAMTHTSRRPAGDPKYTIGLAWQLLNRKNGSSIVWHSGGTGGYASFIAFDPTKRIGVVILTNAAINIDDIGFHLLDRRLPLNDPALIGVLDAEATRRGFEHLRDVIEDAKRRRTDLQLSEDDVNAWGYALLQRGRPRDAIEVFKLNVDLYPDSANTYDSLAEACEAAGDNATAIANYRRSLELNPGNTHAVERLKALEARVPRS